MFGGFSAIELSVYRGVVGFRVSSVVRTTNLNIILLEDPRYLPVMKLEMSCGGLLVCRVLLFFLVRVLLVKFLYF